MSASDERYAAVALEIAKAVVTVVDFNVLHQVGFGQVAADVFDFADAFVAELEVRLEKRRQA